VRYLDVPTHDIAVPFGPGSRHLAAAAISKTVAVVTVAVSATGLVRVFRHGEIVSTLTA
jgi:DNA integrity scanning protein DisA with diadenylate cyclase activity